MNNPYNDPYANPEEYLVNHITAYEELTILSYTPSFLIRKDASTEIKKRYATEVLKRIKDKGNNPKQSEDPKTTTVYIAESGLKEISKISMKEKEELFETWDEVIALSKKYPEQLKVYVIPDSDLPSMSFILGKVSGTWGNRAPWDLLIEYRIGVTKDNLFSMATSENKAKWFLNMPLPQLPKEIKWVLNKLQRESTIIEFEEWVTKIDIKSSLPPPEVAILSAMPNEIVFYQKKFGGPYKNYPSGINRGRFDFSDNEHLELIFPNTGYGRYNTHKSVTKLVLEHPNINSFYLTGVAGGSELMKVEIYDVVVSSEIVELVYEKIIPTVVQEQLKLGRKNLSLNDDISFVFGVEKHSIDDSLKRQAQRLKELSVSDPGKWEGLLQYYTKDISNSEYKEKVFSRNRLPVIHFGPIFSSDHNVNYKKFRDMISNEYGVFGFEMEGGGLAESCKSFGKKFLDIRGISDLCDSSDNQREKDPILQPIASAIASAALDWLLEIRVKMESSDNVSQ